MHKLLTAALIAALSAAPAAAATLEPVEVAQQRSGAFAGARLRVTLGGSQAGQAHAGLGIGPIRTAQASDGRIRTSFADGLEFGGRPGSAPTLSIAGRPYEDIKLQADGKGGVPTWALITGGVVLVLGVAAFVAVDAIGDASTE